MAQKVENLNHVQEGFGVATVAERLLGRTAPELQFHLFGALEVVQNGLPLPRTRTRTELWLLALLVLHGDREVQRSWLAGTFWPDSDEVQALGNLRRSLSNLRTVLGQDAERLLSPTRASLRLKIEGTWSDVLAFDTAIALGDRQSLSEAVDLYRGPLLELCDADWACTARSVRERQYLEALEALAGHEIQAGNADRAVKLLSRIIEIDPSRETSQRRLLEALWDSGDGAAMILAYRAFRLYLHNELRSDPTPETTALFQRLRSTSRTHTLSPRPAVAPSPSNGNLQTALTHFYGREQEQDQLILLMEDPNISLVTLTGMGGCGKTRLAIETGHRLRHVTGMPVWFVALAEIDVPDLLFDAIRNALSIFPPSTNSDPLGQIATVLKEEPALLILDNFEHLAAKGAPLVRVLLERIPTLKVLITSRESFGLAGDQEVELTPLATPRSNAHPDRLLEFACVQLFVDRARARRLDFDLTRQNATAVAALSARLEGIPLAIELAAGWAKLLTPQQMLKEMDHRFDFLVTTRSDLPERHRTLRAALDTSCGLLTPEQRRFLTMLTVFRGGWTLEEAQEICQCPQGLPMLALLRERSLILLAENTRWEEPPRYYMLESLRDYAAEQREELTTFELAQRHAEFYLSLVQESHLQRNGADQSLWLRRLDVENDNLRAALNWFLQHSPEKVLELGKWASWFWKMRGHFGEGRRWLTFALERSVGADSKLRADALNVSGQLAASQGDFMHARSYYEEGLALYRSLNYQQGISAVLNNIGIIARNQNDFTTARRYYEESLHIDEALNDLWGVAASLNNLGNMATCEHDYQNARALHERSLQIRRKLNDQGSVAWSLSNLGNVYTHLGDSAAASPLYQESLTLNQELGDKKGMIISLSGLALLADYLLDDIAERKWLTQIFRLILEIEDKHCACSALMQCGKMLERSAPQPDAAIRLLGAFSALSEAISAPIETLDQPEYDVLVTRLRSTTTAADYTLAWEAGRHMPWQEAVQYALSQIAS